MTDDYLVTSLGTILTLSAILLLLIWLTEGKNK